MIISFDTSRVVKLAVDLATVGPGATVAIRAVVQTHGKLIETTWRSNAVITSGAHGKHYPNSIKMTMAGTNAISSQAVIAPDPGMPQGGMSFEFGSSNQPPHLDGQRALDAVLPKFQSAVEAAAISTLSAVV